VDQPRRLVQRGGMRLGRTLEQRPVDVEEQ
jgi:hypothetical protein